MKQTPSFIAALTFGLAAVASAQAPKGPVPGKLEFNEQTRVSASALWTTDRLANAKPMPLPEVDPQFVRRSTDAAAVTSGPVGKMPSRPPTYSMSREQIESLGPVEPVLKDEKANSDVSVEPTGFGYVYPFSNHRSTVIYGYPFTTVGKLFFEIPGKGEYVCSASVAMNTHTLITARHCVYDYASGTWYTNFVFYPVYRNGPNPLFHNGWSIRRLATWTSGASTYDYDIAFMQVNDDKGYGCGGSSGGQPIGNYTGVLGSTWNGSYAQRQWDIFGYPQAYPFAGTDAFQDEAATGTVASFGYTNTVEVGNPQTGGTSGGPWVIGLDPKNLPLLGQGNNVLSSYTNMVNSVNSFKFTSPDHSLAINGPAFFTYNFLNLYNYYAGLSCP